MVDNMLPIDKINDSIRTYVPEKLSTDGLRIFMWKTQLQCKIHMLKKKGFSDEFIDKFVDRSIEVAAEQLLKEREI